MLISLTTHFSNLLKQGKLDFTEASQKLYAIARQEKSISSYVQTLLNQSFAHIILNCDSKKQTLLSLEQWVSSLQYLTSGLPQIILLTKTTNLLKQQPRLSLKILAYTLYAISKIENPAIVKVLSTQAVNIFFSDGQTPIVFPKMTKLKHLCYILYGLKYIALNEKISELIKVVDQHLQNDPTGGILSPQEICLILEGLHNKENDIGAQNIFVLLVHHVEANHEIQVYFSPEQQEKIDRYLIQRIKNLT